MIINGSFGCRSIIHLRLIRAAERRIEEFIVRIIFGTTQFDWRQLCTTRWVLFLHQNYTFVKFEEFSKKKAAASISQRIHSTRLQLQWLLSNKLFKTTNWAYRSFAKSLVNLSSFFRAEQTVSKPSDCWDSYRTQQGPALLKPSDGHCLQLHHIFPQPISCKSSRSRTQTVPPWKWPPTPTKWTSTFSSIRRASLSPAAPLWSARATLWADLLAAAVPACPAPSAGSRTHRKEIWTSM